MYANAELYMRVDHTRNYGDDHLQLRDKYSNPRYSHFEKICTCCG
jgi:hypothetical protein